MPRPMPVLPAVPSTTTPPGRNAPRATASEMIASAARSLTDPPGFMNSALPRISQPVASEAAFRRISGVWPMASITLAWIGIPTSGASAGILHRRARPRDAQAAGLSMTLTWAATMRQPPGKRTQVCICRPTFPGVASRWNKVAATAKSRP